MTPDLLLPRSADPTERATRRLPWLAESAVSERLAELAAVQPPTDADRALMHLLRSVAGPDARRPWRGPPDPARVLALHLTFPNFAPVIDSIAGQLALQRTEGATPCAQTPVLLVGSPGVGKTTFADRLASALGVPHRVLPMSAMTAGFTLGGLDRGWANGRPGELFQVLSRSGVLNPVITLDEVDKANQDARSTPLGTLYQLLEPGTAKSFVDEYVSVPMDASYVTWLATANDEDAVPDALRSRFRVFRVEAPTTDQMRAIVQAQYRDLRRRLPALREALDPALIDALAQMEPRASRQALQEAAGRAALRTARSGIDKVSVTLADLATATARPRRRNAGFVC